MLKNFKLEIDSKTGDILGTLSNFFKELLTKGAVDALLVPQELSSGKNVVQTLVKDAKRLDRPNPLAFVMPMNSARLISQLTDQSPGIKLGVVLKSCEIRAMIELIKLNQINNENLIVIGVDCLGTYSLPDYVNLAKENKNTTLELLKRIREKKDTSAGGYKIRTACSICEYPIPENADLRIGIVGVDLDKEALIQATSDKGEKVIEGLDLKEGEEPSNRVEAIAAYLAKNKAQRETIIKTTLDEINSMQNLMSTFASCIKCYNCRDACPICYCKECIFDTSTLNPAPPQYINKVKKKGVIRMPMDTLLYHLTRMNHMITSCVGCGQCESACPNDIPLVSIYTALGQKIQQLFDYVPGRNLEEELPLVTFKEDELEPK